MDQKYEDIADRLTWDVTPFMLLRAAVKAVLERPHAFEWTTQGFGMLRTHLDKDKVYRVNVWHKLLRVPGVTTIHDHAWDFKSWVISGRMINRRFTIGEGAYSKQHHMMTIKTGVDGGFATSEVTDVPLLACPPEVYSPGNNYVQVAHEIHDTDYLDGSVTINYREYRPDTEHARVFWPSGDPWINAKPAHADLGVVKQITGAALEGWDNVAKQLVHTNRMVDAQPVEAHPRTPVHVPAHEAPGAGFEMR